MYKKVIISAAFLLLLTGLFIPLWYLAVAGLVLVSAMLPFVGIFVGFFLDIAYGTPSILPVFLAYPLTLGALIIGLCSLFLRKYIRS